MQLCLSSDRKLINCILQPLSVQSHHRICQWNRLHSLHLWTVYSLLLVTLKSLHMNSQTQNTHFVWQRCLHCLTLWILYQHYFILLLKEHTYIQSFICICFTYGMTDRSLVFLPTYVELQVLQHSHITTCSIWRTFLKQKISSLVLKLNYTGQNDGKSDYHKNGMV